jgi:hypothetical protein
MMMNKKEIDDSYLHVYIRHALIRASRSAWNGYDMMQQHLLLLSEDSHSTILLFLLAQPSRDAIKRLAFSHKCFFFLGRVEPKTEPFSQNRQIYVCIFEIITRSPNMTIVCPFLALQNKPTSQLFFIHSCKERSRWGIWLQLICISLACL